MTPHSPPAMAGFMAAGILLTGQAYWGVVACMAFALAASYWCLRGWLPRNTSLAATLVLILLFRAPHYWIQSYWGGAPIFLASLLMLGAYVRVFHHHQNHTITHGLCGVILALLSRPFEGGFLILGLTLCGLYTFVRHFTPAQRKAFLKSTILPAFILLPAYVAFQLYYNHAITGHWLSMPYMAYTERFNTAPLLITGHENPKALSTHYMIHAQQAWELQLAYSKSGFQYLMMYADLFQMRRFPEIIPIAVQKAFLIFFKLYIPNMLAKRDYNSRDALTRLYAPLHVCWALFFIQITISFYALPHYLAPQFAITVILIGRWWLDMHQRYRIWPKVMLAILCLLLASFDGDLYRVSDATKPSKRSDVIAHLQAIEGNDLVFVDQREEAKKPFTDHGWVYNSLDTEHAPIVWAWYMSPDENKKVIEHFKNRKIWYLAPIKNQPPIPYEEFLAHEH
jgi:hypothetical protein